MIMLCGLDLDRGLVNDLSFLAVQTTEKLCRSHGRLGRNALAECLRVKGLMYKARGQVSLSRESLLEGRSIIQGHRFPSRGRRMHIAAFNGHLAELALSRGDMQEALSITVLNQATFQSIHPLSLMGPLITLCLIAIHQSDFPHARALIQEAVVLDKQHNNEGGKLNLLIARGDLEARAGDHRMAIALFNEVVTWHDTHHQLAEKARLQYNEFVTALQGMAFYEAADGNTDTARNLMTRAFDAAAEAGPDFSNIGLLVSGYIEMLAGELEKAKGLLQSNKFAAEEYQRMDIIAITTCALGEIAFLQQNMERAKSSFQATKSLCGEMGIDPQLLYTTQVILHWTTPARYVGWVTFLEGKIE